MNKEERDLKKNIRAFFLRIVAPFYYGCLSFMFWPFEQRGFRRTRKRSYAPAVAIEANEPVQEEQSENPFTQYFNMHLEGPGIWKWQHYLDIYHRHFQRFRGREVHVVEVGIYSGGSLKMWLDYFGLNCKVYGIDIDESCKAYEDKNVQIFIGDQSSHQFWCDFKKQVPHIDILIDDGGHLAKQQVVTFEEIFPHLSPGGVFLCEDVMYSNNPFAKYMCGVSQNLHSFEQFRFTEDMKRRGICPTSDFQAWFESIHLYPFVIVVEKRKKPVNEFFASKHGTEWKPERLLGIRSGQ